MTVAERRELDRERVRAVGQREEAAYRARTPRSAELHERAQRSMPLGVASSFQSYDPYPLFMTDARGSRIWDVGRQRVRRLRHGLRRARRRPLAPVAGRGPAASRRQRHVLHVPGRGQHRRWPRRSSGASAAISCASPTPAPRRRWTRSASPVASPAARRSSSSRAATTATTMTCWSASSRRASSWDRTTRPPPCRPRPACRASRAGRDGRRARSTIPTRWTQILERHRGEIAAIIVEPVQFNIGVVPPLPGFLERVRELATEHGIVLIFDEVKTGVVLAYGGATEWFGVKPDLFCLAKCDRRRRADRRVRRPRRGHARRSRSCRSDDGDAGIRRWSTRPCPAARPASRTWARSTATRWRWPPASRDADQDPDPRRLPTTAGHGRPAHRRQPGGDRRVRAARLRGQRGSQGLRDVHAGAGDQLPRLHRPRLASCGRRSSSTWPTAACCCRPAPTTSGRSPCSTPTRRSTATSPPSATSRRRWLASRP